MHVKVTYYSENTSGSRHTNSNTSKVEQNQHHYIIVSNRCEEMEQFISKDDNSGYKYNKQLIGHPTNVSDTEQ